MIRKLCVAAGCDELALPGLSHCEEHEAARLDRRKASRAAAKLSASAQANARLYNTAAWRRASKAYLQTHPLCLSCSELGLVEAATEVDHIERHEGDRRKFWDRANWQALCHSCHSRKTAREVLAGKTAPG